jgi:hypothetical protein
MTTYYYYNEDGNLQSSAILAPVPNLYPEHPDLRYYLQQGDTVGAYLAQRAMLYPTHVTSELYSHGDDRGQATYEQQPDAYDGAQDVDLRHEAEAQYESYESFQDDQPKQARYAGFSEQTEAPRTYPDPEAVRHSHDLLGLLHHIDPGRRFNSLSGPSVDVVEQGRGTVFAYEVPKRMLVLFLGRKQVNKLIKTIGHSKNSQRIQQLSLPRGIVSHSAIKILVSWMNRACRREYDGLVRQFDVPRNTFAACSLAQTLTMFGLHKDALRVDFVIAHNHFKRLIFADELRALWTCMGEKSRYVYAAIKVVGERLRAHETVASQKRRWHEEIVQLLEGYPALEARVRDLEFNEKFRPTFSIEWCKKLQEESSHSEMLSKRYQRNEVDGVRRDRKLGGVDEPELHPSNKNDKLVIGTRKVAVLRIVLATEKPAAGDGERDLDENV